MMLSLDENRNLAPVDVSKIILGCGNFGGVGSLPALYGKGESDADAFSLLSAAHELGIRRFDTANSYGGGASEIILEKFLKSMAESSKHDLIVSTKVGNPFGARPGKNPLVAYELEFQVDQSLRRLGTERINLLYIHELNQEIEIGLVIEAINRLIKKGKVAAFGLSNVSFEEAQSVMEDGNDISHFHSVQNEYHLLNASDSVSLIPYLAKHKVSYSAYSPLAGGLLTGKYLTGAVEVGSRLSLRPEPYEKYRTAPIQNLIYEHLKKSDRLGLSPGELAIRSILGNPQIESVVIGPRKVNHYASLGIKI